MQHFSQIHLLYLSCVLFATWMLALVGRHSSETTNNRLRLALAAVLIATESLTLAYLIRSAQWSYTWALPLQLCDVALIAVLVSLLIRVQWVWEVAFFYGVAGASQALLTPNLSVEPTHPFAIAFFIGHGGSFAGAIYLAAALGWLINRSSAIRVWWITHCYALAIGSFNYIFDTNYLFLCYKPARPSILDFFGSWPWYIIALEILFTLSICLTYGLYCLIRPNSVR